MNERRLLTNARELVNHYESDGVNGANVLQYDLARFAAEMLDDSPVTMEALGHLAADSNGKLVMRNGQMWIVDTLFYFECDVAGKCWLFDDGDIRYCGIAVVHDLSALRCLLQGLGLTFGKCNYFKKR